MDSRFRGNNRMGKNFGRFAVAVVLYAGFTVYLYQPYFKTFDALQYLLVVNLCLVALGCFVLSRRWVSSFWGSFFAGTIYGFGPFALWLAKFHPTVGMLAMTVPWMFCPAAFGPKLKRRWISWLLSVLPFLAIVVFFQVSVHCRLFAIPIRARLQLADLVGLLAPLVAVKRNMTLVGFYHIPIAALVMAVPMLLAARRWGILAIFCLGTILAFCNSLVNVSPVIWLVFPVLCCSVLVGAGMQGLVLAGFADRRWVLTTAITMAVLSIITLLPATRCLRVFTGLGTEYAELFTKSAKMYILGGVTVAIGFFMTRTKLRICWLRQVLLGLAMAVDMFYSARFIVDEIF